MVADGAVEGAVSDVSSTVGPGQGYLRHYLRQLLLPPPPELGRVLVTKPDTDHDDGVGPEDGNLMVVSVEECSSRALVSRYGQAVVALKIFAYLVS